MKAIIEIEKFGIIEIELYKDIAPITVENFVKLANRGFYNGLTFHRIIKGFMIESYIEDDPCLGFEKTKKLIYQIFNQL